jgi:hypothetical protein
VTGDEMHRASYFAPVTAANQRTLQNRNEL